MKNKFVGIVVFMLVATTVVSATNINMKEDNNKIVNNEPYEPALFDWWNVDQKQTHTDNYGVTLTPPETQAQSFTPTKDKVTAVSLYLFKHGTPPEPVHITVSIRDSLTGSDLTTKTIDTSIVTIGSKHKWVLFDFEDISVTPNSTYYIICSGDAGDITGNAYCWLYSANDTYTQGDAYYKENNVSNWNKWINGVVGDFCFKTYFRKPLDSSVPTINEQMSSAAYGVDVPVWEKGDSWTYSEHMVQYVYKNDGTIWYFTSGNYTTNYTVTDDTGGNYTVKMTSTNNQTWLTIGLFRMKFTPRTKWTKETIFRKTDLAYVSEAYQEKGLVFCLITKMNIPIPAYYSDTYEVTYNQPGVLIPFPLNAGTNGTLPNCSWTGHQKIALYWGLIKLIDTDFSGYDGEKNYTCEMANITVPAGTYDAYNVSVESTFGLGHSISWSYYAPEVGNVMKQYIDNSWNETGIPGFHYECELISTTYTP